jgi:hypothetical protein
MMILDVRWLKAKCSPVCPFKSKGCCMAHLLSQQDDFANQESMLKTLIKKTGHLCIFLLKFHCELNPIEMVSGLSKVDSDAEFVGSTGAGASTDTDEGSSTQLRVQLI